MLGRDAAPAQQSLGPSAQVCTVFETAVHKPGAGNLAPLAIGASIAINVGASGAITGGAYK